MITRRSCSAMFGALLVWAATGVRIPAEASTADPIDSWLRLLSERDAATRIGARIREALPATEAERLLGETADRLLALTPTIDALRKLIGNDFRAGSTVAIEGVVLSRVEAGLCLKLARSPEI